MQCFRFDISRQLTAYLDGELAPSAVARVESHLLDCSSCRAQLMGLREGRGFAERIRHARPVRDAWTAIEAALDAPVEGGRSTRARRTGSTRWVPRSPLARAGIAVAVVLVLLNGFALVRSERSEQFESAAKRAGELDRDEFHAVQIADIGGNTRPHIVAEGRVESIDIDDEDGDMKFKLVDDESPTSNSFVVCEVIRPFGFAPPPVGSRVRVYGVSRFDNQENHDWYEIHPVLGIEMLHPK